MDRIEAHHLYLKYKKTPCDSAALKITAPKYGLVICSGNRTEWSPIRSVIIQVITKSDDRSAEVRFVYHQYDYRPNWTTRSLITN